MAPQEDGHDRDDVEEVSTESSTEHVATSSDGDAEGALPDASNEDEADDAAEDDAGGEVPSDAAPSDDVTSQAGPEPAETATDAADPSEGSGTTESVEGPEPGEGEHAQTEHAQTEHAQTEHTGDTAVLPPTGPDDQPAGASDEAAAATATPAADDATGVVPPVAASGGASPVDAPTTQVSPVDAATTRVPPAAPPALDAPTVQVPPSGAPAPAPAAAPTAAPTAESEPGPGSSRRGPLVAALAVAVVVVAGLAVWLLSGTGAPGPSGSGTSTEQAAPAARVTLSPAANTASVAPTARAEVHVADGRVSDVALTGPKGAVAGVATPDGWRSTGPLAYGTAYTWKGTVVDADGRPTPLSGGFSTVDPGRTVAANLNIDDDATVGVGAPVIVQFNGEVDDKAAVERALKVTTSVPTEGSWAWLPDTEQGSRAHWRPKEYWKPGTKVDVAANLFGVNAGGGAWGAKTVSTHFTIGRSQIVKADVNSFQMVVERDGKPVMTVPASYGLGADPNRNTTNGVHVVMSKEASKLMTNPAYGYFNVPEKWAVRISNNGEFIHANPKSTSAQGNDNVTHGCVNLSTEDAKSYFDTAMFGDPVEVTGSPQPMPRTDIYDWSIDWDEWQSMSAVRS